MKRLRDGLIPILLVGCIAFLVYWRWQVSQVRFFDVDEFSYLHWAANIVKGNSPYVDFFMFFTPGFLWFFVPMVKAFWMDPQIFLAARMVSFIIFGTIASLLTVLFAKTRGRTWALLPAIILLFLPMPYDKFLEVRPDNLATVLALGGLVLQVNALMKEGYARRYWFWSGVLYAVSLVVFVKTIPFVVVAGVVCWFVPHARKPFFLGLCIPWIALAGWLLTLGSADMVWYSLYRLPFEANRLASFATMEPHLFFFPNGSFYGGTPGITLGLLLNHLLWSIGLVVGVVRFFTPFITGVGQKNKVLVEMLIGGIFVLSIAGYIQFFPLKHAQYLIPIAVFVAYYAADGIASGLTRVPFFMRILMLVMGIYYIGVATIQVQQVKLRWTNVAQITQTRDLLSLIPTTTAVVDLEGRMLFWPDAYYICCVPFGLFEQYMSRRPEALSVALETSAVPYIFQGDTGRIAMLSTEDQEYIYQNYTPVAGWKEQLWKRK